MRLHRNLWRFAQYYHDARLNRCYQSMKEFIDYAPLGIIFILYIYVKIAEKYNMGPANLRRMFRILTKWRQAWILSYKHPAAFETLVGQTKPQDNQHVER